MSGNIAKRFNWLLMAMLMELELLPGMTRCKSSFSKRMTDKTCSKVLTAYWLIAKSRKT